MRIKHSGQKTMNFVTKATRQNKAAEIFHSLFRTQRMQRGHHEIKVVGTSESLDRIVELHRKMGYRCVG